MNNYKKEKKEREKNSSHNYHLSSSFTSCKEYSAREISKRK